MIDYSYFIIIFNNYSYYDKYDKINQKKKMMNYITLNLLLTWTRILQHMRIVQRLSLWLTEHSCLTTLVVWQVISTLRIQILNIYCVTSRTYIMSLSSQKWTSRWIWYFVISIVFELGCHVVIYLSHLLGSVCSRSWVLP